MSTDFRVMTSGAFTAAHLRLLPAVERITGLHGVTVTTSIGSGDTSIPNRLTRGEVADLVICDDSIVQGFIRDGLAQAQGHAPLARSMVGLAVRTGAPAPDIGTIDALRATLLRAASIGYSASVSGRSAFGISMAGFALAGRRSPTQGVFGCWVIRPSRLRGSRHQPSAARALPDMAVAADNPRQRVRKIEVPDAECTVWPWRRGARCCMFLECIDCRLACAVCCRRSSMKQETGWLEASRAASGSRPLQRKL